MYNEAEKYEKGRDFMPYEEFNKVFSKRLKYYMNEYGYSQKDLSEKLGVGATSVSFWCNGIKSPRMDKVDKMCELFHCQRSDLIEDKTDQDTFPPLTAAEENHMRKYRKLSDVDQIKVDERIDTLLEEEREELKRVSVS